MFDNGRVAFDRVLASHAGRTAERAAAEPVVRVVRDPTEVGLTRPWPRVAGAGRTAIERLKNAGRVEHPRHRSGADRSAEIVAGLIACTTRPTRPSLNRRPDGVGW